MQHSKECARSGFHGHLYKSQSGPDFNDKKFSG